MNFNSSSGIVLLNLSFAAAFSFNNVTVDNAGTTSLKPNANMDIDGDVTLTAGTFDLDTFTLNVSGNWNKAGAFTFTASTGQIILDGGGTTEIDGSTTFYNLSCVTAGQILEFDNTSTQAVTNSFVINGAVGNEVILRSDLPGTRWELDVSGSHTVNMVDVTDSDASAGNTISAFNSIGTLQNNVNWSFPNDTAGVNAPAMVGFKQVFIV